MDSSPGQTDPLVGNFFDRVIAEKEAMLSNPFPKAIELQDFLKLDLPEPSWFYNGLVPQGSLIFFAGAPGSYKTFFAMRMAVALSEGRMIFNSAKDEDMVSLEHLIPPAPTNVLLIEEEMNAIQIQDRLKRMALTQPSSAQFHLHFSSGFKIKESMGNLKVFCLKNKIKLVIMDPFSSVLGANDENDNAEVSKTLDLLRHEIIDNTEINASVVLIHHPAKSANGGTFSVRGAGDMFGKADHVLKFELKEETSSTKITCIKSRISEVGKIPIITVAFKKQITGRFEVELSEVISKMDDQRKEDKVGDIIEQLRQTFRSRDNLATQKDILEASGLTRTGSFLRAWKELVDKKEIFFLSNKKGFKFIDPKAPPIPYVPPIDSLE